MAPNNRPEVHLQLSGGSLIIRTEDVIYNISVSGQSLEQPPALVAGPRSLAAPAPAVKGPAGLSLDGIDLGPVEAVDSFYKQISQEMYQEVGALARKLSLSIQDLKEVEKGSGSVDLADTGQQLESAKDQLADVVEMTEQATMTIMDVAEKLQNDAAEARQLFESLGQPSEEGASGGGETVPDGGLVEELNQLIAGYLAAKPLLSRGLDLSGDIISLLEEVAAAAPARPAETEPAAEPAPAEAEAAPVEARVEKRVVFPLNDLFQILYELCADEEVKKTIKAVWNRMADFDAQMVSQTLAEQAEGFAKDEGFVMVPLEPLFKALFQATQNDKFRTAVKKLNQARATLFLDQSLPVEVGYEEVEVAGEQPPAGAEPEPPAPEEEAPPAEEEAAPAGSDLAARAAELRDRLAGEAGEIAAQLEGQLGFEPASDLAARLLAGGNGSDPRLPGLMAATQGLVDRITTSVTTIIENLSFQDLAGQKIHKIVATLTRLQLELLKLLVSFRSRLKVEEEKVTVSEDEKKEIAQRDVDEMLDKLGLGEVDQEVDLTAGPAASGRLDQGTVDSMLAELGF